MTSRFSKPLVTGVGVHQYEEIYVPSSSNRMSFTYDVTCQDDRQSQLLGGNAAYLQSAVLLPDMETGSFADSESSLEDTDHQRLWVDCVSVLACLMTEI